MRLILLVFIAFSSIILYAEEIVMVKGGSVEASINQKKQSYNEGYVVTLSKGDKICYISGEGWLSVNNIKYGKDSREKCYLSTKPKDNIVVAVDKAKTVIFALFGDNPFESRNAVSMREVEGETRNVILDDNENYILSLKEADRVPCSVDIYDTSESLAKQYILSKKSQKWVSIDKEYLKSGNIIEVVDCDSFPIASMSVTINKTKGEK